MDTEALYQTLLAETRSAYRDHPGTQAFAPFPEDTRRQPFAPHHRPCADLMAAETGFAPGPYDKTRDAILGASPACHWRDTYKGTDIGSQFRDRFGCYCIIGDNGPFIAETLRLFIVYMPPGLDYPWHHHPAEEIYLVLSGSGLFKRDGHPDASLFPGQTVFHESNQPHALETGDAPILCLVAWRNHFLTKPVWSNVPRQVTQSPTNSLRNGTGQSGAR